MGGIKRVAILLMLLTLSLFESSAQSFNEERTAMTNFIVRMYKTAPFEGVKVFTDYEHSYLLSVLALDPAKYATPSAMNRVAEVKAMSQASKYFSGADITTDMIVRSVEHANGSADTEIIENIREKSIGYVKALEFLTSFDEENHRRVFIYCKELNVNN